MDYRFEQKKSKAIFYYRSGHTQKEIADLLDVTEKTVSSWLFDYKENKKRFSKVKAFLFSELEKEIIVSSVDFEKIKNITESYKNIELILNNPQFDK